MNPVIYVPKGAALEYSPLAANLYTGCSHRCKYCYAPAVLRKSHEAFAADVKPRAGVLRQLALDAKRLAAKGEIGPVLLCFTSDPYQPAEEEHRVTQTAIRIIADAGLGVRILTKNPWLAVTRDLGLLQRADVEFGVSISHVQAWAKDEWEPNAGDLGQRVRALERAKYYGLRTWVSIEPVIYPYQALEVLDFHGVVDMFKIGKLNHNKARESGIDWREFLADALAKLEGLTCGYYIKHDLWAFADDKIKKRWPRERDGVEVAG